MLYKISQLTRRHTVYVILIIVFLLGSWPTCSYGNYYPFETLQSFYPTFVKQKAPTARGSLSLPHIANSPFNVLPLAQPKDL